MKTRTILALGIVGVLAAFPALAQKPKVKPKPKPTPIPGGANQVQGLKGKVGDVLFDGRWRFQVNAIREMPNYPLTVPSSQQDYGRYNPFASESGGVYTPKPGYTLIAVMCKVKNGQKTPQYLHCYPADLKTALTDTEENSYPPIVYDMQTDGAWTTKSILPGSGQTMTVLFAVPPGTIPKDLIFSLKNYDDKRVSNVRVTLRTVGTLPPPPS